MSILRREKCDAAVDDDEDEEEEEERPGGINEYTKFPSIEAQRQLGNAWFGLVGLAEIARVINNHYRTERTRAAAG